jgi:phosphoesterase RecJ-like protein
MNYLKQFQHIQKLLQSSKSILIVQADNPDADSLGSSIALQDLCQQLSISTQLYCAISLSNYLQYIDGFDQVTDQVNQNFDLTIFVDVSTKTLINKLSNLPLIKNIKQKPVIVLDHHQEIENPIDFATVIINDSLASSTGEIIFHLTQYLKIQLTNLGLNAILASIMGDTQSLSNQLTRPDTYRIVANLIDQGANRFELDKKRRDLNTLPLEIFHYKAELIKRTEFYYDNTIAILVLRQEDIVNYSAQYNQMALMQNDLLQVQNVKVILIIKYYQDQHLTTGIRANYGYPIASQLAKHFNGGGHQYASGINLAKQDLNVFKKDIIIKANELLTKIDQ